MNAVAAFENRKDTLRAQLEESENMPQAISAATMTLEQIACDLAQDEQDDFARQRQQAVMALAKRLPMSLRAGRARAQIVLEETEDFEVTLHELIRKTIAEHKRIIFNGDGYDASWVKEAEKRGLLNLRTTPDALAHLLDKKNVDLFTTHNVYSETELTARHEVKLENYVKVVNIEAQTMLDMARKDYLPAMAAYVAALSAGISAKTAVIPDIDCTYERDTVRGISALLGAAHRAAAKLERDLLEAKSISNSVELADFFKTTILDDMAALRVSVDSMEPMASTDRWPVPSYGKLLFDVR